MSPTLSKTEQAEATRAALLKAARELFTQHGYGGVGTEEIVRQAEVTRGALYHHFTDKKDLFRGVLESIVQEEIVAVVAAGVAAIEEPVEALVAGIRAYLDVCTDPGIARISYDDGPSVLGWEGWRPIAARGLAPIIAVMESGMDAGALRRQPLDPLRQVMFGAFIEACQEVANSDGPERSREETESALLGLLIDGLRAPAAPSAR